MFTAAKTDARVCSVGNSVSSILVTGSKVSHLVLGKEGEYFSDNISYFKK